MRHAFRRGLVLSTLAGTCALAMTSTAMAATNGPTTSPEAIGIYANGTLVSLANTPDQTTVGTSSTASVGLPPLLTVNALNATVVSNNYSYASVASITTLIGSVLGITSGTITQYCVTNGAGNFTSSYASIEDLDIAGTTFSGVVTTPNTALSVTLPIGLGTLTVTLDKEVTGPVAGSESFTAVDVSLTTILGLTLDLEIASATCGPYTSGQPTPMASGKGLGIGLGALGLVGGVYGTVRVRRRRFGTAV
jgi:hypothetical protein